MAASKSKKKKTGSTSRAKRASAAKGKKKSPAKTGKKKAAARKTGAKKKLTARKKTQTQGKASSRRKTGNATKAAGRRKAPAQGRRTKAASPRGTTRRISPSPRPATPERLIEGEADLGARADLPRAEGAPVETAGPRTTVLPERDELEDVTTRPYELEAQPTAERPNAVKREEVT